MLLTEMNRSSVNPGKKRFTPEGDVEQPQLYGQLIEADDQLRKIKERIEKCLKSLNEQIYYLVSEEQKLQERDYRKIPKPQPQSQGAGSIGAVLGSGIGLGIAASAVASAVGLVTGWLYYHVSYRIRNIHVAIRL